MIVAIHEEVYEMPTEEAYAVLDVVKSYVPKGIYGVEDEGYIELKNETYQSDDDLKTAVVRYRMKGFRVHCNL